MKKNCASSWLCTMIKDLMSLDSNQQDVSIAHAAIFRVVGTRIQIQLQRVGSTPQLKIV